MAIPIIHDWERYFRDPHEGLGSSYERIILNDLLLKTAKAYHIESALEVPAFGFTGLSGINLAALGKEGIAISLEDHDERRLAYIRELWQNELKIPLKTMLNSSYRQLCYPDASFDLGFNFSALWFVQDLPAFISEFCRVCRKAILICVPNRDGIGYKMQIKDYSPEAYPELKPQHIMPAAVTTLMRRNGWQLRSQGYIDCPPWPDIGMDKERFLGKLLKREAPQPKPATAPVSILPYYRDEDPTFARRMRRYALVERTAPNAFKKYWAHHYHLLFTPSP